MITYTHTPYEVAQRIGREQSQLLETLADHVPVGRNPDHDQVADLLSRGNFTAASS